LDFQGDCFASESFHEDLHATPKTQNQVKSGLFLDVVVCKGATILKLFTSKDKPLLLRWNTFLILDFCLNIVNCT
ncbi:uncharacterized protein LOC123193463, partial [Mangifera indica]|uniref:uncharacterized protein LOC123193463 n=1 Tax=Mangifera indica TaxID=29780 RepID=UPI001CFAA850